MRRVRRLWYRTISIPDGVYLLSHPVATPADPRLAVSLALADFAVLKAAPDFPAHQPLVRLGGTRPANDIRTPGSVYSFSGGVLDGSGVAAGIAIESGRETRVRDVSMKNVWYGLKVCQSKRPSPSGEALGGRASDSSSTRSAVCQSKRAPGRSGGAFTLSSYPNVRLSKRFEKCLRGGAVREGLSLRRPRAR